MADEMAFRGGQHQIEGTVSALLFRNEENGYTVLRMDCQGKGEITVVGCMPGVAPGESLELEGVWGRHPAKLCQNSDIRPARRLCAISLTSRVSAAKRLTVKTENVYAF